MFIAYTLDGSLTSKDVTVYLKYYNDSGKLTEKKETASMGLKSNYGFGNTETSTFMKNPFRVGSSSYGEWFTGEIVSVAMYGYAKTAKQISSDYHNGFDTKDSALIAGYDFASDDKGDYVVKDKSEYKNDLIYTGSNTSLKNNADEKYEQEASLADKGFTGSNALTMEAVVFIPADYDMSTNTELGFVMG